MKRRYYYSISWLIRGLPMATCWSAGGSPLTTGHLAGIRQPGQAPAGAVLRG